MARASLLLERHPKGVQALPAYVSLDLPAKVRHVEVPELEVTDEPP